MVSNVKIIVKLGKTMKKASCEMKSSIYMEASKGRGKTVQPISPVG